MQRRTRCHSFSLFGLFLIPILAAGFLGCPESSVPTDVEAWPAVGTEKSNEVTSLVSPVFSNAQYNRRTGQHSGLVTLTNPAGSGVTLQAPMRAIIDSITSPTVSVANATGAGNDGNPYFDLGSLVPSGGLQPGQSLSFTIVFDNPSRQRFTFSVRILQGPIQVIVPSVLSMTLSAAEAGITGAGLTLGSVEDAYSDSVPQGCVAYQDPRASALVPPNTPVNIMICLGEPVIGGDGGTVVGGEGTLVQIPAAGLNQEVDFAVSEPSEGEVRAAIPDDWPYASAVMIGAETAEGGKAGDPASEGFHMTVTVSLTQALPVGTDLDVYRWGEDYGEWTRLDVKATVGADGLTATFEATEPGTYLVRQHDEYSVPRIDLETAKKQAAKDRDYVPEVGYGLHKIAGEGPIPIVLVHGIGSDLHTRPGVKDCGFEDCGTYARWDNFVTWARAGGLDLDHKYQLWWFLHDTLDAVGFSDNLAPPTIDNNAWQFAQELEAKRNLPSGAFPDETQQSIIVAHSRGGLVTRAFMENWPGGGEQVLTAVTLATPHHGSCLAVPDWMFDTIEREYWGDVCETIALLAWKEQHFEWDRPGAADLAWDNFDGTDPYGYGIPYRAFDIYATLFRLVTVGATVSTNDAGWPTDTGISDPTIWLPPEYVLADNTTKGRRSGTTLWDLNHRPQADRYLNKFILYGGYLYERGGWADALAGKAGDQHRGLAYVNRVMSNFQSVGQTVSHYAANDGFVALQSALYLDGSNEEPIYTTKDPWFWRKDVRYPIDPDEAGITARLRLQNASHRVICDDYDHLDMVAGKDGGTALFENIKERLDWTVASRPTAAFNVEPVKAGGSVALDASGSHDNPTAFWPATTLEYRVDWDASDGLTWGAWGASPVNHAYPVDGTYTISLQVRDQDGMMSDVAVAEVTVEGEEVYVVQPGPEGKDTFFGTSYVQNGDPDNPVMYSGGWGDRYFNYFEFDLSGTPATFSKLNVQFCIYHTEPIASNDPGFQVWRITAPWTEAGVNVSSNPTSVFYKDFGPFETGWNFVDITDLYKGWKQGAYDNFGIKLVPIYGNNTGGGIASSDNSDASIRPKLIIRWTGSEGEGEGEGEGETETILLPGNVPLELVRIPAGSFQMGSPDTERRRDAAEGPVHLVTITYDFYMGKYEVTQAQWLAVMGSWPGPAPSSGYGLGDNYPAYYISWGDAQNFITALNNHITATSQGPATLRLPSEAEWEYACRAGTQTRFYFGDSLGVADNCADDGIRSLYMWYCGNNSPNGTKPVGGKLPNAFGLYDMSGNINEWCQDWWHSDYTGAPADGSAWGPSTFSNVVSRGGDRTSYAMYCRSAYRYCGLLSYRCDYVGFRLASVR